MRCPRCGRDQPDAVECAGCGVIIAKARPPSASSGAQAAAARPPMSSAEPRMASLDPRPGPAPLAPAGAAGTAGPTTASVAGQTQLRAATPAPARRDGKAPTLTVATRALLLRELGTMVGQGVGLPQALEALAGAFRRGERARAVGGLTTAIRAGTSLSDALAAGGFDPIEVAMLRAAERSGGLGKAMLALAGRLDLEASTAAELRAGLGQPLGLALAAATLLPAPRAIAGGFGAWAGAAAAGVVGVLMLAVVLALGLPRMLRQPQLRARLLGIGAEIPGIRALVLRRRYALFFGALAPALEAGVPVDEALLLAADAAAEPGVRAAAEAVTAEIRRVGGLATAARALPGVDEETLGRLATGELSGELAAICGERAATFARRHAEAVQRASRILRNAVATAVTIAVAVSLIGQLSKMIGDPMALLPGGERSALEQELQRAMPAIQHGSIPSLEAAPGAGLPGLDSLLQGADHEIPGGARARRRRSQP